MEKHGAYWSTSMASSPLHAGASAGMCRKCIYEQLMFAFGLSHCASSQSDEYGGPGWTWSEPEKCTCHVMLSVFQAIRSSPRSFRLGDTTNQSTSKSYDDLELPPKKTSSLSQNSRTDLCSTQNPPVSSIGLPPSTPTIVSPSFFRGPRKRDPNAHNNPSRCSERKPPRKSSARRWSAASSPRSLPRLGVTPPALSPTPCSTTSRRGGSRCPFRSRPSSGWR